MDVVQHVIYSRDLRFASMYEKSLGDLIRENEHMLLNRYLRQSVHSRWTIHCWDIKRFCWVFAVIAMQLRGKCDDLRTHRSTTGEIVWMRPARQASHSWRQGATWVVGQGAGQCTPASVGRYNDCISSCIYEYRIATVGYVCRRAAPWHFH